jgi:hypothetical protein
MLTIIFTYAEIDPHLKVAPEIGSSGATQIIVFPCLIADHEGMRPFCSSERLFEQGLHDPSQFAVAPKSPGCRYAGAGALSPTKTPLTIN